MVTGTTAVNIDVSTKLAQALIPYLAIVVGLALILLLLVFRSILIPLKAALGFLLTIASTLGVLVAVFQWGWLADVFGVDQTAPIVSVLPILLIGVVFGLAMDYEVFLVTRMREEYVHGATPTQAVIGGFRHSGRVVTAAAVIMIAVFSGFLLDDAALIKSVGLGLASAVLFDAFVVRMTIVPAVLALLGHRAWALPKWLDRVMPNVDVEGEKLRHTLDADSPSAAPEPVLAGVGAWVHTDSGSYSTPQAFTSGSGADAADTATFTSPPPRHHHGRPRGLYGLKQRRADRGAEILADTGAGNDAAFGSDSAGVNGPGDRETPNRRAKLRSEKLGLSKFKRRFARTGDTTPPADTTESKASTMKGIRKKMFRKH
jgi:RND superfamily putative drug exporter